MLRGKNKIKFNIVTDPKFVKRKRPNNKRAIILLIILIIILFLFYNMDKLLEGLY